MIQPAPVPRQFYVQRHTATGTPTDTGFFHGPNGLLRYPGVDPTMYHLIVGALPGLMGEIPTAPTVQMNPIFQVITGVTEGSGDEPATVCDDAPIGGQFKTAMVTYPFGRYMRATQEVDLGRLGQRVDRAEPLDLRLANQLPELIPWARDSGAPTDILTNEMNRIFYTRAIEFHRLLAKQIWTGNPTNNNAGLGYMEFMGLEGQVNTNWKDAITGSAVPDLNPIIRTFGESIHGDGAGNRLVRNISNMWRMLNDLALRTRIGNVRWAFVMRPSLYYELTSLWACAYMEQMCSSAGDIVFNVNMNDQIALRDDMRRNNYLVIEGQRVEVILDDAIPESEEDPGVFQSDVYLLPISVNGTAAIYFQYYDFGNGELMQAIGNGVLARVMANGAFLDTPSQKLYCFSFQARIEPRLIMRTPWLAGRLNDVQYAPYATPRQPFPDDPYYTEPGGVDSQPGPSYYKPW